MTTPIVGDEEPEWKEILSVTDEGNVLVWNKFGVVTYLQQMRLEIEHWNEWICI